ncbi:glycoside hydrolase family 27 protein [Butyrivibrio sp. NC3005]|uniref:glycoside hydrolase family 27 protein n=1 Tax=Butyrivibrio sp. NC3005 TaxID=1280685 RepID=UPI00040678B3|nr:glycoside hydrolase family 27 protein [Butyrivibrio sp. NC3005]
MCENVASEKKKHVAKQPPMGWNSWDCYGASVTEEELLGNAEYMAKYLKQYGWKYVVCDIQWSEKTADSCWYHKFAELEMDEYSRLIPAVNRFPSSAGGQGFKPIADKIHDMGLKFGIHIMRGIPRQAVHRNTSILGTTRTAREIAHPSSVCAWNTDMYGVDPAQEGAQEYYNSIFELYASWGVDFVKVDDIAATRYTPEAPGAVTGEIDMIRKAIENCGRDMVLSLSPGPAKRDEADFFLEKANMWRMTDDFWDRWDLLYGMFERADVWSGVGCKDHWPDCDMLPLGHIGIRTDPERKGDRMTNFTKDEQKTLMTLWCIFRSPLMFGGDLRDNDEFTYGLLTNARLLKMHHDGRKAHQVARKKDIVTWTSQTKEGTRYVAVFNLKDKEDEAKLLLSDCGFKEGAEVEAIDIWNGSVVALKDKDKITLKPHACVCFEIA